MNARLAIPLTLLVPFLALTTVVLATDGLVGFYREAFSSLSTVLMAVDLLLALGLALVWMREDSARTGTPFVPYLLVTLAIGVAGPLAYLVHRGAGSPSNEGLKPHPERSDASGEAPSRPTRRPAMSALATVQSPSELERMGEGARPYLADEIFGAAADSRGRAARRRFRLLKALDGLLEGALDADERVHFASQGVEHHPIEQLFLGLWAVLLNRRALVVTDRRLLVLQVDRKGRPKALRSQVQHGNLVEVASRFPGRLALRLRDGRRIAFTGVPRAERARVKELLEGFAARSGPPASGVRGRQELCPHCSVPVAGRPEACPRCHRGFKSAGSASLLSLAFPGLGDLYLGLRAPAAIELLVSGVVWLSLATATFAPAPGEEALSLASFALVGVVLVVAMHGPDALVTLHTARKGLYPGER